MFNFNEKEMQEAEKLADLFDRLRKYAREKNIKVVVATAGVQSAPDVTDLQMTWETDQRPKVIDYIGLIGRQERPVGSDLNILKDTWDFTVPIGYSPLRDGVTQTLDGTDEVVESLESLLAGTDQDNIPSDRMAVCLGNLGYRADVESYPSAVPHRDVVVLGGPSTRNGILKSRASGRTALLLTALGAIAAQGMPMPLGGHDDDLGQDAEEHDGMVRYRSKSPGGHFGFGRQAADTSVSGAEKRRWSDKKPNGKPKKGWEK